MPTYDYCCPSCGPFEALRSIGQRDLPADCPACDMASVRVWLTAPRLPVLDPQTHAAMARNERAQHEPRESARYRHPPGCGCGSHRRNTTDTGASAAPKSFAGRRPWMISH